MTRAAVAKWVSDMSDEGLSSSRIRNCFNVLAACLDAAVDEGVLGRNPARGVELPAQAAQAEHRYLTAQQVDDLASAMPTQADRTLIFVLAYGGLRWGEAVALRRGRVDVLRRRLSIAEAATQVSGRLVFGEPKTHRRRYVHLPRFVADELARHLHDRPDDPDILVWVALKGGPLRYNPYRRRAWDPAVTDVGLDGLTPHALRHTCASLMRAAGADVKEIQTRLGHRSPMITLSNLHPPVSRTLSTPSWTVSTLLTAAWCGPRAAQTASSFPSRGSHKSLTRGFRHLEGCPSGLRRRS